MHCEESSHVTLGVDLRPQYVGMFAVIEFRSLRAPTFVVTKNSTPKNQDLCKGYPYSKSIANFAFSVSQRILNERFKNVVYLVWSLARYAIATHMFCR